MVTQVERMAKIETDIGYIKESVLSIEQFITTCDSRYAVKSIEEEVKDIKSKYNKFLGGMFIVWSMIQLAVAYLK